MLESNTNATIVKMVGNARFEIALMQGASGRYIIRIRRQEEDTFSDFIDDFATASHAFQQELMALEGN